MRRISRRLIALKPDIIFLQEVSTPQARNHFRRTLVAAGYCVQQSTADVDFYYAVLAVLFVAHLSTWYYALAWLRVLFYISAIPLLLTVFPVVYTFFNGCTRATMTAVRIPSETTIHTFLKSYSFPERGYELEDTSIKGCFEHLFSYLYLHPNVLLTRVTMGTQRILLCNTHLVQTQRANNARLRQTQILHGLVKHRMCKNETVFIGGDFNATPDSSCVRYLTHDMRYFDVDQKRNEPTINVDYIGNKYPLNRAPERIDYIFTNIQSSTEESKKRHIFHVYTVLGKSYPFSDHFGVLVAFSKNQIK
jgi:endonuclease/exonuclease/phosphatase family metal-dependent hydrolase